MVGVASGQVRYRIIENGTITTESSTITTSDVTVPLGDFSGDVNVHIFSAGGGSGSTVGTITISGNPSAFWTGLIHVAIADKHLTDTTGPGFDSAFDNPNSPQDPGLHDLHAVQFLDTSDSSDTTMRDRAALSVTIRGDLTGEVVGGCFYRVDCLRQDSVTPFYGGTISGSVHSTNADGAVIDNQGGLFSIAYVRAWRITGSLLADGLGLAGFQANDNRTYGSIATVVAGPPTADPSHVAISGDITCEYGVLKEVLCTGRIGVDNSHRPAIRAGLRIERISMRAAGSSGDDAVEELPIFADVDASVQGAIPTAGFIPPNSSVDLIETNADFNGSLHFADVYGYGGPSHRDSSEGSVRRGIFVGGAFIGDILVDYSFEYADVIARSFRGQITIRQMLKGSIVAVGYDPTDPRYDPDDTLDGTIGTVVIGKNADFSDLGEHDLDSAPRPHWPGFNGVQGIEISTPPFEGANRDEWYSQRGHDSERTIDSVIRADRSIAAVHIRSMSTRLWYAADPNDDGVVRKHARARVESPQIDLLHIDNFDSGSVWSGHLNSASDPATNLLHDDYSSIGSVQIGCIGPKADLWVQDCPLIEITGNMFGEIHLPHLAASEVIRIHGKFGDLAQVLELGRALCATEMDEGHHYFDGIAFEESSPRGRWDDSVDHDSDSYGNINDKGAAEYARILIREPVGMNGQIILDADNTGSSPRPGDYWRGDVEIGTGYSSQDLDTPGDPIVISTNRSRASGDKAWAHNVLVGPTLFEPCYRIKLINSGTGAIGMIPYDLDHENSVPLSGCIFDTGCTPHPGGEIPIPIISRANFREYGLLPMWFGRVQLGSDQPGAQHMSMYHCDEFGFPDRSYDFGSDGTIGASIVSVFPRMVQVVLDSGSNGDAAHVAAGRYMLQRYEGPNGYHGLVCGGVAGTPAVDGFTYNFFIDEGDPDLAPCCHADFNCDGDVATDADIEAFFACLAGNCPAAPCHNNSDFNCDGDPGTDADIEAFFRVIAGGYCTNP